MTAVAVTLRAALALGALCAIGYGCWLLRPAAAYIVVGGLLWWECRSAGRRS